jgi:hypothetical protein
LIELSKLPHGANSGDTGYEDGEGGQLLADDLLLTYYYYNYYYRMTG